MVSEAATPHRAVNLLVLVKPQIQPVETRPLRLTLLGKVGAHAWHFHGDRIHERVRNVYVLAANDRVRELNRLRALGLLAGSKRRGRLLVEPCEQRETFPPDLVELRGCLSVPLVKLRKLDPEPTPLLLDPLPLLVHANGATLDLSFCCVHGDAAQTGDGRRHVLDPSGRGDKPPLRVRPVARVLVGSHDPAEVVDHLLCEPVKVLPRLRSIALRGGERIDLLRDLPFIVVEGTPRAEGTHSAVDYPPPNAHCANPAPVASSHASETETRARSGATATGTICAA